MKIKHHQEETKGAFYIEKDHRRIAEMTYSRAGSERIIIDHTEVDDSLRGQGVGQQLLHELVAWVREQQLTVIPLCPFARSVFDKDHSLRDVLQ